MTNMAHDVPFGVRCLWIRHFPHSSGDTLSCCEPFYANRPPKCLELHLKFIKDFHYGTSSDVNAVGVE
jgi:hypothetical protein